MSKIPLISDDATLGVRVRAIAAGCRSGCPEITPLTDSEQAVDHLGVEMPDVVLTGRSAKPRPRAGDVGQRCVDPRLGLTP
jgi:hypothetical protein